MKKILPFNIPFRDLGARPDKFHAKGVSEAGCEVH